MMMFDLSPINQHFGQKEYEMQLINWLLTAYHLLPSCLLYLLLFIRTSISFRLLTKAKAY